jgi:hypothetical protein
VEKLDVKGKDLANGLKPPTPPQPQWVKNNTVKYLVSWIGIVINFASS